VAADDDAQADQIRLANPVYLGGDHRTTRGGVQLAAHVRAEHACFIMQHIVDGQDQRLVLFDDR
jgi:hypothetical protein